MSTCFAQNETDPWPLFMADPGEVNGPISDVAALLKDVPTAAPLTGSLTDPKLKVGDLLKDALGGVTSGLKDRLTSDPLGTATGLLDTFGKKKDKDKKKDDGDRPR